MSMQPKLQVIISVNWVRVFKISWWFWVYWAQILSFSRQSISSSFPSTFSFSLCLYFWSSFDFFFSVLYGCDSVWHILNFLLPLLEGMVVACYRWTMNYGRSGQTPTNIHFGSVVGFFETYVGRILVGTCSTGLKFPEVVRTNEFCVYFEFSVK